MVNCIPCGDTCLLSITKSYPKLARGVLCAVLETLCSKVAIVVLSVSTLGESEVSRVADSTRCFMLSVSQGVEDSLGGQQSRAAKKVE